jgi:two-component system response regulator PilR (NtrC family)
VRALVLEDERGIREVLSIVLEEAGFDVDEATSVCQAQDKLKENLYDILFVDLRLPDGSGMDIVREVKKLSPDAEVVVITAFASTETVKEAFELGVYDYIEKPFKLEDIRLILRNLKEKLTLREKLRKEAIPELIGRSVAIERLKETIRRVAPYDVNILILGESGTGKEIVARAIHDLSMRKSKPFVAINCAALPGELLESELFGYKKGAFTGAVRDKRGLIEKANGGTVFLDEIGDMPLKLQAKLLRFLETRRFIPLGATEEREVDVRIISATNRNLKDEIKKGNFREDLYYRIATIVVEVPPLRKRREDIPLLVEYFVEEFSRKYGKKIKRVSKSFVESLMNLPLEGNVRELRNLVEREVILSDDGIVGTGYTPGREFSEALGFVEIPESGVNLKEVLAEIEKAYLLKALEMAEGKKRKAAQLLGLTLREFRYRLAKHNIGASQD